MENLELVDRFTKPELKRMAKAVGAPVGGNMAVLAENIQNNRLLSTPRYRHSVPHEPRTLGDRLKDR
jgi:hypothetical protein